ncbi:MAG: hypothetical protein QM479_11325, partial [Pseudomonadota bacterium]
LTSQLTSKNLQLDDVMSSLKVKDPEVSQQPQLPATLIPAVAETKADGKQQIETQAQDQLQLQLKKLTEKK